MSQALLKAIQHYHPNFTQEALDIGLPLFKQEEVPAKAILSSSGAVCKSLYFTETSVTRCFYQDQEGEEQTLWMKPSSTFITEYKSFVHQQPSNFSLQCYEPTVVYSIERTQLLDLYQTHQDWALFGLYLTEQLHIVLIDVFVNLLANDATQNYRYIEYAFPRFLQVAPLKHIASMLQISPVSLSRI